MIGAGPKNINAESLIAKGAHGKNSGGILELLNSKSTKSSQIKNEFQKLLETQHNSEESILESDLNPVTGKLSLGKKIKNEPMVGSHKIGNNSISKEVAGSEKLENDTLAGLMENKDVKPLKLGLSSRSNQKADKIIDEYLNNQNNSSNVNMAKNSPNQIASIQTKNFNNQFNGANPYAMASTNHSLPIKTNVGRYQNFLMKDKDNLIKFNPSENKNSKAIDNTLSSESTTDNLLDFTLRQDTNHVSHNRLGPSENNSSSIELGMNRNEKVLNLDQININDPKMLIDKITNYMVEKNFENKDSIDLTVKHHELGDFKISANRLKQNDGINLEIITSSDRGHRFFVENEQALIKSLSTSGIKLSDLKVSSGQETFMTSHDDKSFSKQHSYFDKTTQYNFDEDRRENADSDSERRRMLWEMFKERKEA